MNSKPTPILSIHALPWRWPICKAAAVPVLWAPSFASLCSSAAWEVAAISGENLVLHVSYARVARAEAKCTRLVALRPPLSRAASARSRRAHVRASNTANRGRRPARPPEKVKALEQANGAGVYGGPTLPALPPALRARRTTSLDACLGLARAPAPSGPPRGPRSRWPAGATVASASAAPPGGAAVARRAVRPPRTAG